MLFLRAFIKRGLLGAVGRMPEHWVILNAAGWLEKGVLMEEDLREIQAALDAAAERNGEAAPSDAETPEETEEAAPSGTGMPEEDGEEPAPPDAEEPDAGNG